MSHLVSLHNQLHKNLRVNTALAEAQSADLHMAPVVLSEFLKLSVQFPIALTKNRETGRFVCVAMFGLQPGENLFCQDNRWDSLYVPLQISRQPFFLGADDTETDSPDSHFVVCIDTDNDSVQTAKGEPLFDETGQDSAYLTRIKSQLAALLNGEGPTRSFVDKLIELELLQAMRLEITLANDESLQVEGMYTINEERLGMLPEDDVIELHKLGYLAPIYTMISSLSHIYSLINKRNALQQVGEV